MKLFTIMPCRGKSLEATVEGFNRTGVDLIAYNDTECNRVGEGFSAAGLTEDLGSFYIIPKLSVFLNINASDLAVYFYTLFVFFSFLIGAVSIFKMKINLLSKISSILILFGLSLIIAFINDYYIFFGALPILLFPWFLNIKDTTNTQTLLIYFIFASIIITFGHLIRSHSGTAMVLIYATYFTFYSPHLTLTKKMIVIIPSVFISILILYFFQNIIDIRVDYLESLDQYYSYDISGNRVLWHNIYYSLGYLSNNFVFNDWSFHQVSDQYSYETVMSINPNVVFASKEYDEILKVKTINFINNNFFFFINTIFAKAGVLLMYFIIFSNIGLFTLHKTFKNREFYIYIFIGLIFNALFGIAVLPYHQYLMGFFTFATFIMIYNFNFLIVEYQKKLHQ